MASTEPQLRVVMPFTDPDNLSGSLPSLSSHHSRPIFDIPKIVDAEITPNKRTLSAARRHQLKRFLTVFLICFINSLTYINRYTLPSVIGRLHVAFNLSDARSGLIQTAFEIVYVLSSPLFGYLGDRFDRRYVLSVAVFLANASGLASSFVPESSYLGFLFTRALLGMGEAACANIGPVLISDMFVGNARSLVMTIFQFAIPIGIGIGYMAASLAADLADDWRWAFRLTPGPIWLSLILLVTIVREPQRGEAERATTLRQTSFFADLKHILKTPSYTITTIAFIGVAFSSGAFGYWSPYLISRMYELRPSEYVNSESEIGTKFGLISIVSGMIGVVGGAVISGKFVRPKCGPSADAIVSGFGVALAAPSAYALLMGLQYDVMLVAWMGIFGAIAFMCCCFELVSEITMNVVVPTRRVTAAAFMSSISHLLGDALSPCLTGMISDRIRAAARAKDTPGSINIYADFISLQQSLFLPLYICAIAGGLFLLASLFTNKDSKKAKTQSHREESIHLTSTAVTIIDNSTEL